MLTPTPMPGGMPTTAAPTGSPLLTLPQGAAGQLQQALPMQPGSLLPVKIMQQEQGVATLMLGQFKLMAKLPAQLPAGNLWVLLVDNGNPPKLRLLSQTQATELLAARLAEAAGAGAGQKQPGQLVRQQQEWPMQQSGQAGQQAQFTFHPSSNGDMLYIDDAEQQTPQGMIERDGDEDGFTLHGRLDLKTMGMIHFALRKAGELPLQIDVRAANHDSFLALQQPFHDWLASQKRDDLASEAQETELTGHLSEGSDPIVRSSRSTGRTA